MPLDYLELGVPPSADARKGHTTLVLRHVRADGKVFTRIWHDTSPQNIVKRAYTSLRDTKERQLLDWTAEADTFLLNYYNVRGVSTTWIAEKLKEMSGQKFTKNAVISRYHTLKRKEQASD
jgi:hypothetical protein